MTEPRTALIARREWAGYTHESLADLLGASVSAVSTWERGINRPGPRFRRPLAAALGLTLGELDGLLGIESPHDLEGHLVQKWLNHYDSLVLAAGSTVAVGLIFVPHLLQTKAYATVIEQSGPGATAEQVSDRVAARIDRQKALVREPDPLVLHAFVDETVLLSRYGGSGVMIGQLDHLTDTAMHPNIELRLLPADGRAAFIASEFELLTKPDDLAPFMAYTTDPTGPNYHEGFKMKPFVDMHHHVNDIALTPGETIRYINQLKDYHRNQ